MDTSFREAAAQRRTQDVSYSHLSIELDHLYMDDFKLGLDHLRKRIRQIAPWYRTAITAFTERHPTPRPRISTCFLVDDYFSDLVPPGKLIPELLEAARDEDLPIDYLARESGCDIADGVELAALVAGRLVSVPVQGTNGSRPPTAESGWLSNGQRTPSTPAAALHPRPWLPPVEAEARNHSIFLDVELWDEWDGQRRWSCPMLAAVWQLLRLGLLRDHGRTVIQPRPLPLDLPDEWIAMPPVVQLNPRATSFHGYRTLSLLDDRFLSIEHAVRVILNQVGQDSEVMERVARRAGDEGVPVPADVTGRIAYVFMTDF
ncbi:MAG TPA: SCO2522 family protein [Actinocrinis sp.]|uniref:SCO2522 family protein n=1 Tax=Actinocrinis sp. TaxID=1920516 RepID=UPI002DDD2F1E|nr:SCO2522 family protein [Actinocrinis sp.]HEV2345255.1 SCO2522 family protein [Actinocrinis sp.]